MQGGYPRPDDAVDDQHTEVSAIIEWDVAIEMSDGLTLRADAFRPDDERPAIVLLGLGPYAKGLPFEVRYPDPWRRTSEAHPDVTRGTTSAY